MILLISYLFSTMILPAFAISIASFLSFISISMFSAISRGSFIFVNKQSIPCWKICGNSPTGVVTTGISLAMASMTALGETSNLEARTNISTSSKKVSRSFCESLPRNLTSQTFFAKTSSSFLKGPSPAMKREHFPPQYAPYEIY